MTPKYFGVVSYPAAYDDYVIAVGVALQETAKDLGTPGRDDTYGWGLHRIRR
jgi:hypothetical protein